MRAEFDLMRANCPILFNVVCGGMGLGERDLEVFSDIFGTIIDPFSPESHSLPWRRNKGSSQSGGAHHSDHCPNPEDRTPKEQGDDVHCERLLWDYQAPGRDDVQAWELLRHDDLPEKRSESD